MPLKEIPITKDNKSSLISSIRGPTPLILAILYERVEIVEYMIEKKGASLSISVNGLFPIHYACVVGRIDILSIIIKNSKDRTEINRLTEVSFFIFMYSCIL